MTLIKIDATEHFSSVLYWKSSMVSKIEMNFWNQFFYVAQNILINNDDWIYSMKV